MPNQWDLTGENIENTYQRVLQTPDGVNIFDGTGSAFTVTAVAAPAGPNQSVQFNDAGTTSGSSNFTFNKATNAVTLTGSLNVTDSIYFSGSGAASRLRWNDTDGTLDLGLKGGNVTLQIGQEEVVRVVNKTGINLTEAGYQAVRLDGAQGNRVKVALAKGDADGNSLDTLGLVTENIAINAEGFVTTTGLVRGINTSGVLQGETWSDGDALYLSPTTFGSLTNIPPTAPSHSVRMGYVVQSNSGNGSIYVKVDNGYELDELHNVNINASSLAYGDLLMYDTNVWYNTKQLTGSYGLTGSLNITGSVGSIIGVSSSNAALRVTQTGTGDAIVVEDSANPDTTPFVVAADGRVGIGVQAPLSTYKLHVRNGTVTNSVTWGGSVGVFENSGSNAYLSILSSDTYVAGVGFGTAAHRVSANLNWNSTTKGFNLATNTASAFLTFATDTGTERMRITSGGLVGINTASPQYIFDVSGSSRITGDLTVTGIIDGGTF